MLLLLSACLYISDAAHHERLDQLRADSGGDSGDSGGDSGDSAGDSGDSGDSGGDSGLEIAIDRLDPEDGSTEGGTSVVLRGGPFDGTATVSVGGHEAQITAGDATSLTFVTPPGAPGPADVEIVTDSGEGSLTGGFRYWPDGDGMIGAVGEFAQYKSVGDYWGGHELSFRRANVALVQPVEEWTFWKYWGPSLDNCLHIGSDGSSSFDYAPDLDHIDMRAGELTLEELSFTTVDLPWDTEDEDYSVLDVSEAAFIEGGVYTATVSDSTAMGDFTVAGVFYPPEAFTVTSPDVDGSFPPLLGVGDLTFRWSGGSPGEAMLIQVGMLTANESTFEEQVYCAAVDDGSFTIPSSLWEAWAAGRTLNILVGRYEVGTGILPYNNARVATAAQNWIYAAGTTR